MCIYIYMYMGMYPYVYIYMYIFIIIYLHLHVPMHVDVHVHLYTCVHIYLLIIQYFFAWSTVFQQAKATIKKKFVHVPFIAEATNSAKCIKSSRPFIRSPYVGLGCRVASPHNDDMEEHQW